MDNLTPNQRHYCMSRIKAKDTRLETRVRSALHRQGYRFRKHLRTLPGTPDVVFPTARVAIFIDGDFWHGYDFDSWRHTLSAFWSTKIQRNIQRDTDNHRALRDQGWIVIRLWQHDIDRHFDTSIQQIASTLDTARGAGLHTHPSRCPPRRFPDARG